MPAVVWGQEVLGRTGNPGVTKPEERMSRIVNRAFPGKFCRFLNTHVRKLDIHAAKKFYTVVP